MTKRQVIILHMHRRKADASQTDDSYAVYHDKLFVQDTASAAKLSSSMTNEEYLDAISAPRVDPSGRTKKKPLTKRQLRAGDESEDSDIPVVETTAQGGPHDVGDGQGTAMDLDETGAAP